MYLVGLTGGIASGKSAVARMLIDLGCPLVDADAIARQVVEPGMPAWGKIYRHFGEQVIKENGEINRDRLGEIIFSDEEQRKILNSFTHPEIHKAMMWKILWHFIMGEQFVVLDVPLLFETKKLLSYLSYTMVVFCDEDTQLKRLIARNNLSEFQANQRIQAQLSLDEKCAKADYVIDNSSSLDNTKEQVLGIYNELRDSKKHLRIRLVVFGALSGIVALTLWGVVKILF